MTLMMVDEKRTSSNSKFPREKNPSVLKFCLFGVGGDAAGLWLIVLCWGAFEHRTHLRPSEPAAVNDGGPVRMWAAPPHHNDEDGSFCCGGVMSAASQGRVSRRRPGNAMFHICILEQKSVCKKPNCISRVSPRVASLPQWFYFSGLFSVRTSASRRAASSWFTPKPDFLQQTTPLSSHLR